MRSGKLYLLQANVKAILKGFGHKSALLSFSLILLGLSAFAQTTSFTSAGSYTYTVPGGVTSLTVDMAGAQGGSTFSSGALGGKGGRVQATLAVSSGQILYVYVGGTGTNGSGSGVRAGGTNGGGNGFGYGGGGGGMSDIRKVSGAFLAANELLVAAGGGGGGFNYGNSGEIGGYGGGTTGGAGYEGSPAGPNTVYGGAPGTPTAGGAGGTYCAAPAGSAGQGGNAAGGTGYAGGGGGGFYGGGAGCYGGGGGGSSWLLGTGVSSATTTLNYQSGVGYVNITPVLCMSGNSGPSSVCTGSTITLSNSNSGGTWSSSTPSIANVGTGGVVTGYSSGTATISYTIGSCSATTVVTVNQTPTGISGTFSVCMGGTTTLTNGYAGGTWSASPAGIVSINAGTGAITTVSAGSTIITYTLPGGCTATAGFTVNPNPAAIGGPTAVCVGQTITATDGSTGGVWSSSAPTVASIWSGSGLITGMSAGTPNITYTLGTGCYTTSPITVNPGPGTITGTNFVCVGLTTTLGGVSGVGTWTSSNTTLASVVSSTGVVTGVSAGVLTITYTITATGCYSTTPFTVNPNPAAIVGATTVCQGLTTSLTDAATGGLWSSSAPGVATIGSTTGVVTGISGGSASITYSLPTGCIAATAPLGFVVNPTPATIDGGPIPTICPGTTTTLTDATGAGTWVSNNTAVATMAGAVATGVAAGTSTITFTLTATGCATTSVLTVNPNPAAITGTAVVCQGLTTTLADGTGGGTWSSLAPANGSVVSATGVVTGVSGSTTATIVYTLPTGCLNSVIVTVNPLPASIGGSNNVCVGLTTTLTDATGTSTWTSSNTALATVGASTGIVTGVAAGSLTITYTNPANGCVATLPFTVNPTPAAIVGANNVCVAATDALSDATGGGTWSVLAGTGTASVSVSGVVTGLTAGSANILYTLPAGCLYNLPFTINSTPSTPTGASSVCTGLTTTLTGSGGGTWTSSSPSKATVGGGTGLVTGVSAGTTTITYTTSPGSCFAVWPMTVNQTPAANTGAATVCMGSNTTLANSTSGGTWSSVTTAVGTVSVAGVVSGIAAGNTVISYTLPTGCFANTTVTVNSTPAAITGANTVCTGATLSLTSSGGTTWSSSNTAQATVNSSGVVSGVAVGTPTITYTTGTCYVIYPITVNQTPPTIVGSGLLCLGLTTTLTDGIAGGTWASSNTGVATITSGGVITAAGLGNSNINYTLPAGCTTLLVVTVNTQPVAISGAATLCTGATTTLSDGTPGGAWTSSAPSIATIGSGTGLVTGVTAGNVTMTYTMPGSCIVTFPMTINLQPAAITGTVSVCVAGTTLLSDATAGGVWSSSVPTQGSIGSATGILAGIAPGNPVITYTYPGGCTSTVTATVNPQPNVYAITGGGSYCSGGTGVAIALSGVDAGISYQLYNGLAASGSAVIGGGTPVNFGNRTAAGTYTAVATNTTTGCSINMSGSTSVIINPNPFAFSVTGGGSYCAGSTSTLHVGLSGSAGFGAIYTLMLGGVSTGLSIPGTGVLLDFGIQSATGNYTVLGTYTATGCTTTMTGSATISINSSPTVYTVTTLGGTSYCAGGSGVHIGLNSSDAGISYQLYLGGAPSGTPLAGIAGTALDFGLRTTAGTYTVLATNTTTGCNILMSGAPVISVNPLPTLYSVTAPAGTGYCAGGSGLTVGLSGSTLGVNYQLYLNGVSTGPSGLIAGTGIALTMTTTASAGVYTIVATNATTGCIQAMSGSVTIVMNALPTAYNVTGGGAYCATGTGVHIFLSGSQIGVSYQLYNTFGIVTSAVMSGTGGTLDFGAQTVASTYTITATNISTGCTNAMTGSQVITINALPNVYPMSANGSFCFGGTGWDVQVGASDPGISYQLYLGATATGAPILGGGGGGAVDFGNQLIGGTYTVKATNTGTGCSVFMSGSTVVTVNPLPALFTVNGGGSFCVGGAGVNVGLSGSQLTVNYQLYNGSSPVAGGPTAGSGTGLGFGLQTAAGPYSVIATSAAGCVNNMTGTVLVTTNPLPNTYGITGGAAYCAGAAGTHIGLASSDIGINYQLYIGSVTSGTALAGTGGALDFGVIAPIGTYSVSATNATTGCQNGMTGTVTVATNPVPTVYPVTGGGPYCAGGTGVAINMANSDPSASYQLYMGTVAVGLTVAGSAIPGTLFLGNETAAGTYTVVARNPLTGCTSNMTGSATVSIIPLPNVYTITGGGNYCTGGSGVTIGLSGSDATISYSLIKGGVAVPPAVIGSGTPFNFGLETNGTYTVIATNPVTSCSVNMLSTAVVGINPLPGLFTISAGGHYCAGSAGVNITLSGSAVGINYQLMYGGVPVGSPIPGTLLPISFGSQTAAGIYTVKATNAVTGCSATMTGTATVVIDPLPTTQFVTGGGNYCPGGSGVNVGLLSSSIGTSYVLYNGSSPVTGSVSGVGSTLPFGLQTTPGVYTVIATAGLPTACTSTMSGSATVGIYALPTAYSVAGGGSYCAGGTGLPVSLSGSDINTNYQLFNDDTVIGGIYSGSGSAINFGLQTAGGSYMVVATSTTTSCVDTMYDSASITVNALPIVQTVSGGGSYCPGGTGVNILLGASETGVNYQLYKGTLATGSPVPGTGLGLNFGLFTGTGIYTIKATNASTLCASNMAGSDTINLYPLPVVYNVTGGGGYCSGGTGMTIGLSNSQTGVVYQLYRGTSMVGVPDTGTGAAITFGLQTGAGIYTIVATNLTSGCTNNMSGTATIVINALPVSYNVTGGGGYCTGGTGVNIGLSGSTTGVSYQLMSGGATIGLPVTGTGLALNMGWHTAPGNYEVVATKTTTGCQSNMLDSVAVIINPLPALYSVSASSSSYCIGGTGVTVYLSNSQLGVNYQLYRGATPIGISIAGTGTTALDFGPETVAGTYTILATNTSTGCVQTMTGSASFTIDALPVPYSVTGGGNYCAGGAGVSVGLAGSSTGVSYQLFRTGIVTGTPVYGTGAPITLGTETSTGVYTVVATNTTTGCISNMAGSATVGINPLPDVFTAGGGGAYCTGSTGVNITLSGSVTGINYQLSLAGLPYGGVTPGTGLGLTFGPETTAGTYSITAMNTATGCSNTMAGAPSVAVNSLPVAFPVTGGGNYCPGGTGVSLGLYGSVTGVKYQLYDGTAVSGGAMYGTGLPVNFGIRTATGSYSVVATDTATGCTMNMTGMVSVGNYPLPAIYNVTGGGSYCAGGTGVNIGLDGSNSGINYQLIAAGGATVAVAYGTGAAVNFGPETTLTAYTVLATNAVTTCSVNMAGTVSVSVNPLVTPTVSITSSNGDTACAGLTAAFTASITNGGSNPLYMWTVNGMPAGSDSTINYVPSTGDVINVLLTSNAVCATPDTVSSSMTMFVIPQLTPAVSIASAPGDIVCRGTSVAFTASPVNGGYAPSYAWKKNGLPAGTNSPVYNYPPANGDIISCDLTSNYQCRTANTVMSNAITMEVDTPVTPQATITVSPLNYITSGEVVTFTATIANAVIDPSYQWMVNGHFVPGATYATYSDNTFTNGQTIKCIVISGGGCGGSRDTTNSILLHVSDVAVQQINGSVADIQLVPNPNKGAFVLKGTMGTAIDQEVNIEITNMLGQVIYTTRSRTNNGTINEQIQLSSVPANGMYIVNLRTDSENKVFHMVIEQ